MSGVGKSPNVSDADRLSLQVPGYYSGTVLADSTTVLIERERDKLLLINNECS